MNSIFQRTSVRSFLSQEIEEEKVLRLLKAGMASPSAGNQRPWEFFVVKDKGILQQLALSSPYAGCTSAAPMAIVLCSRTTEMLFHECVPLDMSSCCENILLQAVEENLGAVWLGVYPVPERMKSVKQILKIEDKLAPFAIIPVGYANTTPKQNDRYEENRVHFL